MDLAFHKDAFAARTRPVAAEIADVAATLAVPRDLSVLDDVPQMIWIADPDGGLIHWNAELARFVGFTLADPDALAWRKQLLHPEDRATARASWAAAIAAREAFSCTFRVRSNDGFRWVRSRGRPRLAPDGAILQWFGTFDEVHEAVLVEERLREVRSIRDNILEASSDCIKVLTLDGTLKQINDYGVAALELPSREAVIGSSWIEFWPKAGRRRAADAIRAAAAGKVARFAGHCFTLKGAECWWDNLLTPIRDADGRPESILCISRNVTGQKRAAEGLRRSSERDALTGLPNRRAFERHLKRVIASAREAGSNVALVLIDLDHFKNLNDTLGHLAGDHLLRVFGRRLRSLAGDRVSVARLGGDEFAVVLSDCRDEREALETAAAVMRRNEEPVTFGGRSINGGLSIGCAVYPRDAGSARDLFKLADIALYDIKAGGRGGAQLFNPSMMDAAEAKAQQLDLARRAIQHRMIVPHYQPKVSLDDGTVVGFEALLRLEMPGFGLGHPAAIAAAFNEYDLASRISAQMQDAVLADVAQWRAAGLDPGTVSINASPVEFLRDDYAERLLARIERHGVEPAVIEIEITEHGLLDRGSRQVMRALEALTAAGVRIALDDFGTGNASLTHLREFPVTSLKIDKSFIRRMMTNLETLAIVQAMIRLGSALSIEVIAEGIETPEQLHLLAESGCGIGQGYLIGKAMPAAQAAAGLRKRTWGFRRSSAPAA
ncbi:MAG: EAL domain-containing protein [Sphingomonadales bacterium]|nr:EAL domain-containing protein [Sphingomonadales bacterium]